MHEMSLAIRVIEIAILEAEKAGARTLDEIEVEVGQLAGVMAEALSFCLDAAARGTRAEGAEIVLIQVPGQGHCPSCQQEVAVAEFPAQCPKCGGFGVKILAGTDLRIRSINIDNQKAKE